MASQVTLSQSFAARSLTAEMKTRPRSLQFADSSRRGSRRDRSRPRDGDPRSIARMPSVTPGSGMNGRDPRLRALSMKKNQGPRSSRV